MTLHSLVPPAGDDTISPSIKRLNLIEMPSSSLIYDDQEQHLESIQTCQRNDNGIGAGLNIAAPCIDTLANAFDLRRALASLLQLDAGFDEWAGLFQRFIRWRWSAERMGYPFKAGQATRQICSCHKEVLQ
ncbi:hypothetical protein GJ496_008942 [Pomphorhynchus laevis]|nr:hypothetical protein GJ496_008942 [Pomphorhynchus laevis]